MPKVGNPSRPCPHYTWRPDGFCRLSFFIPRFRDLVKRLVRQNLERVMRDPRSGVTVMMGGNSRVTGPGEVKNVTPPKTERSFDSD